MRLKNFLFRLAAILTAFMLGVGIFNAWQYFQMPETVVAILPLSKQETLFAPHAAPLVVSTEANWENDAKEEAGKEETDDAAEEEFNPDGYYYASYDDKLPKDFKDFDNISITTRNYENNSEENGYQGTPIPPEGYLWTKIFFNFTKINISEKRIAFETEKVNGVSYKFSGNFIEKAPFWRLEPQTPVLEGRLVKMLKGNKVAEVKVRLIWYGGC